MINIIINFNYPADNYSIRLLLYILHWSVSTCDQVPGPGSPDQWWPCDTCGADLGEVPTSHMRHKWNVWHMIIKQPIIYLWQIQLPWEHEALLKYYCQNTKHSKNLQMGNWKSFGDNEYFCWQHCNCLFGSLCHLLKQKKCYSLKVKRIMFFSSQIKSI